MATLKNSLIDGWAPSADLATWAEAHGFGPAVPMTDRSLRELSGKYQGEPAGLYLWEGEANQVYVGISNKSVTSRLRQHVTNFQDVNIQSFRFLPHTGDSSALRATERELIYDLCRKGFICFNREHSSVIYGSSVLDDVVTVEEQAMWSDGPSEVNGKDLAGRGETAVDSDAAAARSRSRFDALASRSDYEDVRRVLATYLRGCMLYPGRTEAQFWSISCLPQLKMTGGSTRLVTVNVGMLEVLWINESPSGKVKVGVATDSTLLPPRMTWLTLKLLGASMLGQVHSSAGPNAEYLSFKSPRAFVDAMSKNDKVRSAAARFALDRVRRGRVAGRYVDAHNVLLAQDALKLAEELSLPSTGIDRAFALADS